MIISSSSVGMTAAHRYSAYQETSRNGFITSASGTSMIGTAVSLSISSMGSKELLNHLAEENKLQQQQQEEQEKKMAAQWKEAGQVTRNEQQGTARADSPQQLKLRLLESFVRSLNRNRGFKSSYNKISLAERLQQSFQLKALPPAANTGSVVSIGNTFTRETVTSSFTGEAEQTAFCGSGSVTTADGRQIDFNVQLEMSRSFMQQTNLVEREQIKLHDPLVINFGGDPTTLTDQKFYFDIDSDGKKDSISFVSQGSGFLALDKNQDGIINDGSELFGTQSGDGFKDLARYDKDGNGWIDEADEVFNQLKIWTKDEHGKDVLMNLKEAGIGAIYLGNVDTQFSLNQAQTNATNGIIQKTGIYLKESGEAGTVHHIDLAVG